MLVGSVDGGRKRWQDQRAQMLVGSVDAKVGGIGGWWTEALERSAGTNISRIGGCNCWQDQRTVGGTSEHKH